MIIDMEKIKIENINLSERLEKIVRDELNQKTKAGKFLELLSH
jgi:hypothetical protein